MATPPSLISKSPGYRFPTGSRATGTIICGILMAWSARSKNIEPGSFLFDNLLSKASSPRVLQGTKILQNVIFYFLFGAHAIETAHFAATKLKKHGELFSLKGLAWILTTFIGGKFAIEEFDVLVAESVGLTKTI
jgi:hypothetical protein